MRPPRRGPQEGEQAAGELADALRLAGLTLPSLRGDLPTITGEPLVQLGRASVPLVRELAQWIRDRADRTDRTGH
ncbi:hypothetical protein [Streptomyces physcomitrii]|uniref:Transcriptional regulator n=1 Tax=Streptomyces physcomitrii TaxID=2724184 RepID=A0ABX1H3U7_9ACTN|nr:hypothetical protein [Streptomyces physcomitrii]NKI43048.1 hypothetical protein [Streptomyces physcomitrii]